ncbi:hypothetical protein BCY89_26630 [Sphingobacterium siyangense]|uniref:Uncharacterized protein n=1 Tax=Sphingobacterium siyangense TaxID=459529 RepID=A0A420G191_9SPHI|nr:hypothetical protein [Sphingobacterium siyangense]QRY60526.1 hypothetical protein JVX97_14185 [Sphingobacterium siyangense]RKF38925.1 hypothetical protein BCY89_26630 [Sphingobacterium siyangense]
MENNTEEFEKALIDVRKAHRLIFKYQEKMLDLMNYIKSRLDFPEFIGKKHFSNSVGAKRSGSGMQRIWHNMWAWDFVYPYVYEYYLGDLPLENYDCNLSLIQYSDTGYFDQNNQEVTRIDVEKFVDEEQSVSKILFVLQAVPKNHKAWKWDIDDLIMNKKYASSSHKTDVLENNNTKLILYSFPLSHFIDENSTNNALNEFCTYCKSNGIAGLELI